VVVPEPVENDGNGVRLSLECSRSEDGVAVLAVPELDGVSNFFRRLPFLMIFVPEQ